MQLNNQWIIEEIKGKFFKNLNTNENGNTTCQYLYDSAKAALRGKFVAIQPTSENKKNVE